MSREHYQVDRVLMEAADGRMVWVPLEEVAAFQAGQEAVKRGELPPDYERKKSALLSMLKGEKK